jgi:transcriptional antiterminator RfaH
MFSPTVQGKVWFCLRSKPKHEHIAGGHLSKTGFEVFVPRVRYQQHWKGGIRWVTEALFPGYFFSSFDLATSFRQVTSSREVTGVVHFGTYCPAIPQNVIEELQRMVGETSLIVLDQPLSAGDSVKIISGKFEGLEAVVQNVMPGRQRVDLLMNFLGTQVCVQTDLSKITKEGGARSILAEKLAALHSNTASQH